MNHPSGYASFLFSSGYFHIFSDAPADFSVLPRILFCIFFVRLQKIICCFFIRIIRFLRPFSLRRNNFSCLFPSGTEKFFISFPYFLCFSWIFSKEKSAFFGSHYPVSDMFFLVIGIIFMFFPVQGKKFFSPFSSFSHFFRGFSKEKSSFSGMNFPSGRTFFPFLGEYFRIFFRVIR